MRLKQLHPFGEFKLSCNVVVFDTCYPIHGHKLDSLLAIFGLTDALWHAENTTLDHYNTRYDNDLYRGSGWLSKHRLAATMVALWYAAFGLLFAGSLFLCHWSSLVCSLSILQMSGGVLLKCKQRHNDFSLLATAL